MSTSFQPLRAEFFTSAPSVDRCPRDDLPEVAFVGRSNAGKSSALNRLTGSKQLARVSKTPGRTRLINMFNTELGGRLVDLPGYGYARAARQERNSWGRSVDEYLRKRPNIRGLVLVMDIRHPMKPLDKTLVEWSSAENVPVLVLLNKADKMKRGAQVQAKRAVDDDTKNHLQVTSLLFSSSTGLGAMDAVDRIQEMLGT